MRWLWRKIKGLFKKKENWEIDLSPYFTWNESGGVVYKTCAYEYSEETDSAEEAEETPPQ